MYTVTYKMYDARDFINHCVILEVARKWEWKFEVGLGIRKSQTLHEATPITIFYSIRVQTYVIQYQTLVLLPVYDNTFSCLMANLKLRVLEKNSPRRRWETEWGTKRDGLDGIWHDFIHEGRSHSLENWLSGKNHELAKYARSQEKSVYVYECTI